MPFDLSESFIAAAERELGAELPESYRQAMERSNGGEVDVLGDVWQLHPIADTSDRKRLARTANHILRETASMREWSEFPQGAVAIASNGTGDQLLFLRKDGQAQFDPTVFCWSHETGSLEVVATDFSEIERI